MTYEQWQAECVVEADALGLPTDLWEPDDPYDLLRAAQEDWTKVDPDVFVRDMFAEDLAEMEHDAEMFAESLEYEVDEDT